MVGAVVIATVVVMTVIPVVWVITVVTVLSSPSPMTRIMCSLASMTVVGDSETRTTSTAVRTATATSTTATATPPWWWWITTTTITTVVERMLVREGWHAIYADDAPDDVLRRTVKSKMNSLSAKPPPPPRPTCCVRSRTVETPQWVRFRLLWWWCLFFSPYWRWLWTCWAINPSHRVRRTTVTSCPSTPFTTRPNRRLAMN